MNDTWYPSPMKQFRVLRCWSLWILRNYPKIHLIRLDVGGPCSYWVSSLSWSRSMCSHNYKPFSFFIDCQAKTSTSVTAHLAQHSFFAQIFLRGTRPKNHIFTGKEWRFVPCQLWISWRGIMQGSVNRSLIEIELSQVIRGNRVAGEAHKKTHKLPFACFFSHYFYTVL